MPRAVDQIVPRIVFCPHVRQREELLEVSTCYLYQFVETRSRQGSSTCRRTALSAAYTERPPRWDARLLLEEHLAGAQLQAVA